jgi:hypothetical protein
MNRIRNPCKIWRKFDTKNPFKTITEIFLTVKKKKKKKKLNQKRKQKILKSKMMLTEYNRLVTTYAILILSSL